MQRKSRKTRKPQPIIAGGFRQRKEYKDVERRDELTENLEYNIALFKLEFHNSPDLIVRRFQLHTTPPQPMALIYIDGLVSVDQIQLSVLRPLMLGNRETGPLRVTLVECLDFIEDKLITVGSVKRGTLITDFVQSLHTGNCIILVDGWPEALLVGTPGWEKRGISEPDAEVVIRGPKEGFIETIRTNTAMLRRIISQPGLTFECMTIGRQSNTQICIAYITGIVRESLLTELKTRLHRIDTGSFVGVGLVEQLIEDAPFSIFSTMGHSERPDVVAAGLLEGRVAVMVEGNPVVLTIPYIFFENFQTPDDYNYRTIHGTFIRWVRYAAFSFNILSPATYVALVAFHQEIIPTPLLVTIAASSEGTPFPAVIEVLIMGLIFETLREAGVRLPRPIGQTVSIVGALVVGEAVVSAGIISAPVVIVVAVTAIAAFTTPSLDEEGTVIRLGLTILSGFLGAFGIVTGLILVLIELVSLRSFGVPYLFPAAPFYGREMLQDVAVRAPWWAMLTRPRVFTHRHGRQKKQLWPRPPEN